MHLRLIIACIKYNYFGSSSPLGIITFCKDLIYYTFTTFDYSDLFLFGSVILSTVVTFHAH
jgi:hypothetical protein